MGGCISEYIKTDSSNMMIEKNVFFNNSADFGAALNLEHRDNAGVFVIDNNFQFQKNTKHVIGCGTDIKTSGYWTTFTVSIRNIYNNSYSISLGVISIFAAGLMDTNSTYLSNK